ncbi:hypothetical protein ACWD3D_13320, partial [Streptomyces sp. NPDC002690]
MSDPETPEQPNSPDAGPSPAAKSESAAASSPAAKSNPAAASSSAAKPSSVAATPPAGSSPSPASAASGPDRLTQEDRSGFVSAFVTGVRPDGESGGRSSGRLLMIGTAVVVALGLTAVAVGAFGGDDTADKATPAGAAMSATPSPKAAGHTGATPAAAPRST